MMMSQSMMCCNGSRLNCSRTFTHDKGVKLMALCLFFGIFLTLAVVLHIEHANVHQTAVLPVELTSDAASSYDEPTDLTDDSLSYGIIFDCGSSGTRVYIYYWPPHNGNQQELLSIHQVLGQDSRPMSKKVTPGLSTYNKNAVNAAEYLKPLLDFAADIIPKHKHKNTPLYIMATAGMRLIDESEAQDILDDITKDIPEWFDFQFTSEHVEVIPGKLEGMYAWISLNYMLNKFSYTSNPGDATAGGTSSGGTVSSDKIRSDTVGVVDMGGGSLQIAFEVANPSVIKDDEHRVTFNLGPEDRDSDSTFRYTIYTATFLGYGANSALSRYRDNLVQNDSPHYLAIMLSDGCHEGVKLLVTANKVPFYVREANPNSTVIGDDCQAKDSVSVFTDTDNSREVTLRGTGDVTSCMKSLKPLLSTEDRCTADPCSIAGVHQPAVPPQSQFYGISEYWYSTYDVLNLKDYYNYNRTVMLAQKYCQTPWSQTLTSSKKKLYPHADMERLRDECFKVSWVMEALHDGLNFPRDFKSFQPVNEIGGQEVQWSLGALIYKTRSLRDSSITGVMSYDHSHLTGLSSSAPYILVACIAVVALAIVLYCRHLQKMKVVPGLHNVPSMSYFMVDADQAEQGLLKEEHSYP